MEAKIKPQDLRQGNLLQDKDSKRIGYVISMTGNRIRCKMSHSKLNQHISEWEPIPLSEDWLERMGWKKDEEDTLYIHINYTDGLNWYDNTIYLVVQGEECPLYKIKYVHEVMNLYYSLTGSEITIN